MPYYPPAQSSSGVITKRWDFQVSGDRSIIQTTPSYYGTQSPPGFTGDVPVLSLDASASPGEVTFATAMTMSFDFGTELDSLGIQNGDICKWRAGVGYNTTSANGTAPSAWVDIPGFFEPISYAQGSVATGYLGGYGAWTPNFPSPQFSYYAGSWMWSGAYDTILHNETVWNGSAPTLGVTLSSLWVENSYDLYLYFLELEVT